jgi:hypothetical protein
VYNCRENAYYIKRLEDGTWVNIAGTPMVLPITKAYADANCMVYNSNHEVMGTSPMDTDENGKLYMLSSHKHTTHMGDKGPFQQDYFVSTWTGTAWVQTPVTSLVASGASKGIRVFSQNDIRIYIKGGELPLEEWRSTDGGSTWQLNDTIYTNGESKSVSILDESAHPDAYLTFYNKASPKNAREIFLWGQSGYVGVGGPTNLPPSFTVDPFSKANATEDSNYSSRSGLHF